MKNKNKHKRMLINNIKFHKIIHDPVNFAYDFKHWIEEGIYLIKALLKWLNRGRKYIAWTQKIRNEILDSTSADNGGRKELNTKKVS